MFYRAMYQILWKGYLQLQKVRKEIQIQQKNCAVGCCMEQKLHTYCGQSQFQLVQVCYEIVNLKFFEKFLYATGHYGHMHMKPANCYQYFPLTSFYL